MSLLSERSQASANVRGSRLSPNRLLVRRATMKRSIGIFLLECLPETQTFVYQALHRLTAFEPHVLAKIFDTDCQFDFSAHPVHFQYSSTPLSRMLLYYLCPRFASSHLCRTLLSLRDPFVRYIAQHRLHLLHAHFALDGLYALSLTAQQPVPLLVSLHGGYDIVVIRGMDDSSRREYFENVAHFTVPSEFLKLQLLACGCPQSKVTVLPYGAIIDAVACNEKKDGKIRVLLVGRLTETKGIMDALEAVDRLMRKYPLVTFTIVAGQKDFAIDRIKSWLSRLGMRFQFRSKIGYRNRVIQRIRECNNRQRIRLINSLPHDKVRRLMAESDIFILPSKTASDGDTEGLPVSILEAQATGLPVVATQHSGIPEAVQKGISALLVPEGDVEALSQNIERLIVNPALRQRMGRAGREYAARNFSMDKYINRLEEIYSRLIV
jgi:colanic acid/amylovoran biosynthesis glycosyltransferase